MRRTLIAAVAVTALLAGPARLFASTTTSGAAGVPNLSDVKTQVVRYYTSGAYEREVAQRIALARAYVDRRVKAGVRKPAIVLDIDDTALSDYAYEKTHDFGYDERSYRADESAQKFTAIKPTLALAKHAAAEGVTVFFVTGRRGIRSIQEATIGNLAKAGYPAPKAIYFRPDGDHAHSVIPYKSDVRRRIVGQGYTILASIGDQWSDLRGGYAEQIFKLPNPMYLIP